MRTKALAGLAAALLTVNLPVQAGHGTRGRAPDGAAWWAVGGLVAGIVTGAAIATAAEAPVVYTTCQPPPPPAPVVVVAPPPPVVVMPAPPPAVVLQPAPTVVYAPSVVAPRVFGCPPPRVIHRRPALICPPPRYTLPHPHGPRGPHVRVSASFGW